MERVTGRYVRNTTLSDGVMAFIPNPLPPTPPIEYNDGLREAEHKALLALGRLDGMSVLLPEKNLFLYFYVRKEAVFSSQIEGTQSSLTDLLLFENDLMPGVPANDVIEVSNYVAAMDHGFKRFRSGFPLSVRLIRDMHQILLSKGRGASKTPGDFRKEQVWIAGGNASVKEASFVPPPWEHIEDLMADWEKFIHDERGYSPTLLKAALAHVQFETIHPFRDGNGRIGRLLIPFLLCAENAIREPLLYPSLYFKETRQEYYDRLQAVRTEGDWEGWYLYFLKAVAESAGGAISTAENLRALVERDWARIQSLGRVSGTLLRVHNCLAKKVFVTVAGVAKETGLAYNSAKSALQQLTQEGITFILPASGATRLFVYREYITLLDA